MRPEDMIKATATFPRGDDDGGAGPAMSCFLLGRDCQLRAEVEDEALKDVLLLPGFTSSCRRELARLKWHFFHGLSFSALVQPNIVIPPAARLARSTAERATAFKHKINQRSLARSDRYNLKRRKQERRQRASHLQAFTNASQR